MKIWHKVLDFCVTGMGFGAITCLLILGIVSNSVGAINIPLMSVIVVFICSGLIGELSFLFYTNLSYLVALLLHLIGTFTLFSIMMLFNHWLIDWQTLGIFIFVYIIIWIVIRLTQEKDIPKINRQIKKRNGKDE